MPTYAYKAKQGPRRTVTGTMEAAAPSDVVAALEARGLVPVGVRAARAAAGGGGRVRTRDVIILTYQLASLSRSGVPILRALRTIRDQTERAAMRGVVERIEQRIRDGAMLSEAMQGESTVFSELYINMVRSGEAGGVLDRVLTRLAEAMDRQDDMRRRVQGAMAYPGLTLSVGLLTVFVLLTFFMPRVLALFESYRALPLPTRLLVGISGFLNANWYWFAFGGLLLWGLARRWQANAQGRLAIDAAKLRTPGFARLLLMADMARFARTLALLTQAGLPIERALRLATGALANSVLRADMDAVREQTVSQGNTFSDGLKRAPHVPAFMANMVAVGEEAGRLDEALDEVAAFYERQVERQCALMLSLIEPLLILAVGGMVGFIVAAMLLPVFQLGTGM